MFTLTLLIVAAALTASVFADGNGDLLTLTADNFDDTVNNNDFVLVAFVAPWCGHCKKLHPEFEKAATVLKGKVPLGTVDATVESDLASKFEVRGYPTLKFFRSGEASDYNGPREADGIVAWVNKKSGPPSEEAADASAAAELAKEKKNAVVGTFKAFEGAAFDAFMSAAKSADLDDFAFVHVKGDEDKVELHTAHTDVQVFDSDDLKSFVLSKGYPLVDELPQAWERYSKKALPLAIVFVDKEKEEENKALLKVVEEAAEQTQGKFSWSYADGVRFKQQIDRMGADGELPVIAAMKLNGKSNYPYSGERTAEALSAWGNGIADGSVKPTLKSEEIPADNDGPVTTVVGKNFVDVALDAEKDVLLAIVAPWCGHCKALHPVWDALGEKYKDNANVVIARIDGTANDIDVDFRGFPTIKFFPAGSSELSDMVDYAGGREEADFVKFIETNAKNAAGEGEEGKEGEHSEL